MPKADRLLTPQQQRFVFAILSGATQVEAYKAAGYKGGKQAQAMADGDGYLRQKAAIVANGARVASALAHARAEAARRAEITVDDLVAKLDRAYEIAVSCDPPQTNGAAACVMGMGKLLGLVVDRTDVTVRSKPSLLPTKELELSEDDWKRQFGPQKITHNDR